jgi:hypothetical protein
MTMSTDTDILEYMPDLLDYGIQDFSADHAKSRLDILRRQRIEWWPKLQPWKNDIRYVNSYAEMDEDLLTESQFTRSAVFHVLSYYILPKLAKFNPDGDRFENMMKHFHNRFEEEINLVMKDGVEYDLNNDNVVDTGEKLPRDFGRLVR